MGTMHSIDFALQLPKSGGARYVVMSMKIMPPLAQVPILCMWPRISLCHEVVVICVLGVLPCLKLQGEHGHYAREEGC